VLTPKELKMVSAEWLKKTELFGNLEEPQLNALLAHSTVKFFSEGEAIFRKGEDAKRLYILIEGTINLAVKTEEKIDLITSKVEKEGAVFGMPSLIEPFQYNVTATCLKPSNVLIIDADHIRLAIHEDPRMGMEIMTRLASIYFNRLNEMRAGISNFLKTFKTKKS
jgi:CRP-like cAMP-binding protein